MYSNFESNLFLIKNKFKKRIYYTENKIYLYYYFK